MIDRCDLVTTGLATFQEYHIIDPLRLNSHKKSSIGFKRRKPLFKQKRRKKRIILQNMFRAFEVTESGKRRGPSSPSSSLSDTFLEIFFSSLLRTLICFAPMDSQLLMECPRAATKARPRLIRQPLVQSSKLKTQNAAALSSKNFVFKKYLYSKTTATFAHE